MLLDTIILVVRETIEAGILMSVLLAISKQHQRTSYWLLFGVVFGAIAARFYSLNFSAISESFEYTGQELLNATLQFTTYGLLMLVIVWLTLGIVEHKRLLIPIFTIAVALTVTQELTEMMILYTGFFQSEGQMQQALTSGFVGLMIGISFGVICFHLIGAWGKNVSKIVQIVLLAFVSCRIAIQAIHLLIQIDWISAGKPLWNSSWLLSESSMVGQITYALFGYEATPTAPEALIYTLTLVFVTLLVFFNRETLSSAGPK